MNPTQIREILNSLSSKPHKSLGQNFLIDKSALNTIVEAAEIKPGDKVLEIGPGLGVLTRELVARGAKVIAIEKDKLLAEYLMCELPEVEVVAADAARLDWKSLKMGKNWKFVSNLPYSITSLALRKALYEMEMPPELVVVMIQKEVAERIVEPQRGGKMSLLSLMISLVVETPRRDVCTEDAIKILKIVPPGAFYPPPKVKSAILKIAVETPRRDVCMAEEIMQTAKKGFAHPRKLLQRNLGIEDIKWKEIVEKLNIDIKARAEDLSHKQWVELYRLITDLR